MARRSKLKVYCTPIGFHDAYVAAPSQKAALEAWGSDRDLFARGVAQTVTDPELMKEPLAHPGAVVKRLRGSAADQIAALPEEPPEPRRREKGEPKSKPKAKAKPRPRPDRSAVEAAERALAEAETRHRAEEAAIAAREAELARERRALAKTQGAEIARLERTRDSARRAYDRALAKWRA